MTQFKDKKLVLEGILSEIKSMKQIPLSEWNGVVGPGSSSTISGYKQTTTISLISEDKKETDLVYDGVILPDSIGNPIQVYHNVSIENKGHRFFERVIEQKNHLLYDTKLERWYE